MSGLTDRIIADMRRDFPIRRLECDRCGNTTPGSWDYLTAGWPMCCGYTMRLITAEGDN